MTSDESLENIMQLNPCPFAEATEDYPLFVGIYLNAGPIAAYDCKIDNGPARGGLSRFMPGTALTPCTMQYAKTCPLYQKTEN